MNQSKIEALQDEIRVLQLEDEMRIRQEEKERILAKHQRSSQTDFSNKELTDPSATSKSKNGFLKALAKPFKSGSKSKGDSSFVRLSTNASVVSADTHLGSVISVRDPAPRGKGMASPTPSQGYPVKSPPMQSPSMKGTRRARPMRRNSIGPETVVPRTKSVGRVKKSRQNHGPESLSSRTKSPGRIKKSRSFRRASREPAGTEELSELKFSPSPHYSSRASSPHHAPVPTVKQQGTPRPFPGCEKYEYETPAQAPCDNEAMYGTGNHYQSPNAQPSLKPSQQSGICTTNDADLRPSLHEKKSDTKLPNRSALMQEMKVKQSTAYSGLHGSPRSPSLEEKKVQNSIRVPERPSFMQELETKQSTVHSGLSPRRASLEMKDENSSRGPGRPSFMQELKAKQSTANSGLSPRRASLDEKKGASKNRTAPARPLPVLGPHERMMQELKEKHAAKALRWEAAGNKPVWA